jgi:anti-sigma regulatory factor (Ser/Thr protein kinase)
MRVSLRARIHAPAAARQQVVEAALIPPHLLDDVLLLSSELVTNSVRHAKLQPEDPIEFVLHCDTARVRVDVVDAGPFFDYGTKPESDEAGGLGLLLVDRIASRWGVERRRGRGTRVWFERDIARPTLTRNPTSVADR